MAEVIDLFIDGPFTSYSGVRLPFKINCDALTDADLATLAAQVAAKITFRRVAGIPRGGLRFADALQPYAQDRFKINMPMTIVDDTVLIVDDVLTTGESMILARGHLLSACLLEDGWRPPVLGVVIFARGPCPTWVRPIFQLCSPWAL